MIQVSSISNEFFLIVALECPDALDRRALYDARTKIAEQEKEIKTLRQSIPNKGEQDQLKRNYQELQQRFGEEQQKAHQLRSQIIDPKVLAEKDRQIATLQAEKQSEIERIRREKDAEIDLLRNEVSGLTEEAEVKQKM